MKSDTFFIKNGNLISSTIIEQINANDYSFTDNDEDYLVANPNILEAVLAEHGIITIEEEDLPFKFEDKFKQIPMVSDFVHVECNYIVYKISITINLIGDTLPLFKGRLNEVKPILIDGLHEQRF
jgi:hypothetical protein